MLISKSHFNCKILFLTICLLFFNTYAIAFQNNILIDLLVWDASEETASIWSSITSNPAPNTTNSAPQYTDFKLKPGFRAGFLFHPHSCFWDSKIYWTYFSTEKGYNYPPASDLMTSQFFSGFLGEVPFLGVDFNWRLAMNMLDYTASHAFKLTEALTFCPSIGLKGGTIRQNIHAQWTAIVYGATENVKNNFVGIGPTLGLNLRWKFFENLTLVGDLLTAWMWGNWKGKDVYIRPGTLLELITPTTITSYMNNSKLGTIMFNYFMGFEWVYRGRSDLTFKLGYEMQLWTNQLRLLSFQQLPLHGDLTLQGATCRIHIDL